MTTTQGKKILVKTKKIVATKSFRLFDFHIYDECPSALLPSQKEDEDAPAKREQKQFIIQMFGINETGETCSITITDFQPYFYVKVGDDWTRAESTALHMDICKRVGYMASSILSANLEEHKKLYGFSAGKKYKFVKFTFANTVAMNKVKNMWYGNDQNGERCRQPFRFKGINLELYESNIPPLLRYFHIHEISPSGWVQIFLSRTQSPAQKTTTCNYEYVCALSALQPIKDKETRVPYKICSFDIEASSSHGDFPIPIKSYKRLAMNMVDCFNKEVLSQMNMKSTITKMVMAAFGHDSYRGIDLVYPKNADEYTKEDIKKRISVLLSTSVQDVKKMTSEETKAILCIDDMFKQMTETFDAGEGGEEGAEEGEGEEAPPATPYPIKKTPAKKMAALLHTTPEYTIIHVIESKDYDRDEKIKIINETMVNIFPKLEGDKVTFIGSTFLNYGDVQPYKNHCLVLGTCDDVEGAIIETTETESELLLKWTELIQKENPDIIIGYNIFGFDYEFMFRRAQENHCERQFLLFSRKMNEICAKMTESDTGRQELQIENTKVVLASGEYDLRYYKAAGRLQIDMYTYFRRDFNLPSYKLDDVAGQYISDSVKKTQQITHEKFGKVTELYSSNLTGLNVNDFIHIEISNFTSDYLEDGKKFRVLDIYTKTVEEPVKGTDKTQEVSYSVILIGGHPTIDHTKTIKWGMAKDDVSPQDIFRLSNGSAADRAIVAKYCIQDCNLVHHLMNKIDVLTGYVEMSRICSVPISFLVFRGQGIKLTSYVAKKCREKETLMPDLEKTKSFDEYEGAIVLPPKCSMYMDNPVACVDYASLYPSSMISNNLSQDSKVWTKEYDLAGNLIRETGEKDKAGNYIYDGLPGYEYVDVTFDSFKYTKKTPTSKAEKVKSGIKVCRWAQLPNNQKSIMPAILEELLKARSDTRKLAKTIKDPFMQNILDKRQLGYKVTANSLYGQCGAKTSTFYEQDVAACTTATGRMMIMYAKRIIEEVYGNREYETKCHGPVLTKAEYVYGDSVTGCTPIYLRIDGSTFDVCTIDELGAKYGNDNWVVCKEDGKQDKEFCELSRVESWTENGWTKLYRVIRHQLAPHKKILRVLTHTGMVDCTDDHSLLKKDKESVSPKDVSIGDELLHYTLKLNDFKEVDVYTEEQAQVMGFFFGDGSCGKYNCNSGVKASWALNNANIELIEKYKNMCIIAYPDFEWVIMDTLQSSNVYKLSPRKNKYGEITRFVEMYRNLMYYKNSKIIPNDILLSNEKIRQAFWNGMYDADGDKDSHGYIRIDQKNQISAANIILLANSLDWSTSINTRSDKENIYRITMTKLKQRKNPCAVKKMYEIPYDGYVYDLTTENHHFAAGIGNMIVHNTDSVFFTFNLEDPKTGEKIRGKKALEVTIEIAQDAAHLCTQSLKPPMELAYEKTLMPFVLLSKKRYVGMLYETDPNKGKLKYMGLSLKRRDSCDYLKDVYGEILNILMKENDIKKSIDFLDKALNDLVEGNVPMEKLMITRALRSDYKNPNQIAHKVLADRIGKRDQGNEPKPGDRMRFVFIQNNTPRALLGDRIETPEYILENKINIDYTYYITNQLMKPLQQLFGLAVEKIWEFQKKQGAIKTYRKDMEKMEKDFGSNYEVFMKRKEKYCSLKIKALLFDKILNKIANKRNNIQMITNFFN
jgi:DNA polymerase elongation subunit (family B)